MIAAIMMVQAAAELPPIAFDLAKVMSSGDCSAGSGDAITVCGRSRQPAEPFAPPADIQLFPKAEFGLFGKVRSSLQGDQDRIGGIPSNAAKVKISVPF